MRAVFGDDYEVAQGLFGSLAIEVWNGYGDLQPTCLVMGIRENSVIRGIVQSWWTAVEWDLGEVSWR